MTAQIYEFPRDKSKLYLWAEKYVDIWSEEGWLAGSKYFGEFVPKQLWHQVHRIIEREFLKRGIHVEF